MNSQEVLDYMRHEWHQAVNGVSEQWHHLRQRTNHSIVSFSSPQAEDEAVEWGLLAVEMYETDDRLVIHAEVPGLDGDSIEVKVDGSELLISGCKPSPSDISNSSRHHCREIIYGTFERRIALPHLHIDDAHNTASCNNGVLTIALPLLDNKAQPARAISVH
jgi:HSP20 family protein